MTFADLWQILAKKKQKPPEKAQKVGKSDEERSLEIEERRNEIELNRLKINEIKRMRFQKELEDIQTNIQNEIDGDDFEDDEEEENPLIKLLAPIIAGKLQEYTSKATSQESPHLMPETHYPSTPQYSDDQLRGFIKTIPKSQRTQAKIMPKGDLYKIISSKAPMTPEDFERGYQLLVTEF